MTYLFFRSMVFKNYSLNVFAHFFAMIDYKYKCTLTRKFCENKTVQSNWIKTNQNIHLILSSST